MPRKRMASALIVPAYGYVRKEENAGSNGTKARIDTACKLILDGYVPPEVIMPFPQRRRLGANAAAYARKQRQLRRAHITARPRSWGTWDDMHASYNLIREVVGDYPVRVHIVSDQLHLMRIWLVWLFTHPKGWRAKFYVARHHRGFRGLIHELGGIVHYFFRGLHYLLVRGKERLRPKH